MTTTFTGPESAPKRNCEAIELAVENWDQRHADAEAERERVAAARKTLQLEAAKVQRDEMLVTIANCECAWPVVQLRNGDGHADDCPAHRELFR